MHALMICGILILSTTSVMSTAKFQPPWMFMGRPLSGFRQTFVDPKFAENLNARNESQPLGFNHNIDEDDPKIGNFYQRYWHNHAYSKPGGPQFLIISGETEASPADVFWESYPHVQYASKLNAGLWILEHRFYGKSMPFGKLYSRDLRYLDASYALEDIAQFISYQNDALNLSDPQWVVFGGGAYAGALALWFRELYPQLAIGAVASSPMVNLKLDFHEYLVNIEDAYSKATLWCSTTLQSYTCADILRSAFSNLDHIFTSSESSDVLQTTFKFSPPTFALKYPYDDAGIVHSLLASYLQIPVQYANVNANLFNQNNLVRNVCDVIVSNCGNAQAVEISKAVNIIMESMQIKDTTLHVDYGGFIKYLNITDPKDPLQASTRAWLWQVCNEFGGFHTALGQTMISRYMSLGYYAGICTDVFGREVNAKTAEIGIYSSLSKFGGNDYVGTNVVISEGSEDPWRTLSLEHSKSHSVVKYVIEGAGHASDMAPMANSDSLSLRSYRNMVLKNLKKWLVR